MITIANNLKHCTRVFSANEWGKKMVVVEKKNDTQRTYPPKNETLSDQWTNNSLNRGLRCARWKVQCTRRLRWIIIGRRNISTGEKIAKRYCCSPTLSYIRKDVSRLHVNLFATRNRISRLIRGEREFTRIAIPALLTHFISSLWFREKGRM